MLMGRIRDGRAGQRYGQDDVSAGAGFGLHFQDPAIRAQALPDAEEAESAPLPEVGFCTGHLETYAVIPHFHFQVHAFPPEGNF
jgi:hypothetical protein